MSVVRFAEICDHCGKRSAEYGCWYGCRECGECVCTACSTNQDDESGKAYCKRCAEIERLADMLARMLTNGKKRAAELEGDEAIAVWDGAIAEELANRTGAIQ